MIMVSEITDMIILCHEMKWDYFTFINQPTWFITGLREKINLEVTFENLKTRRLNKQLKYGGRK